MKEALHVSELVPKFKYQFLIEVMKVRRFSDGFPGDMSQFLIEVMKVFQLKRELGYTG